MRHSLALEAAATCLATTAVSLLMMALATALGALEGVALDEAGSARDAIGFVVVAPLVETPIVMVFMRRASLSWPLQAALCGAVMGALHVLAYGATAAGAVLFFFVNALIYAWWRDRLGVRWGAQAAIAAHAAHNALASFAPAWFWAGMIRLVA